MTYSAFNPRGPALVEARLYFGRNIRGVFAVEGEDWRSFLAESVTPHFPGFTVTHTSGYWEDVPEQSIMLSILMEDTANNRGQCQWIAEHYNSRFDQDAVAVQFIPCVYEMVSWPNRRAKIGPMQAEANARYDRDHAAEAILDKFLGHSTEGLVTVQGHDDLHNH